MKPITTISRTLLLALSFLAGSVHAVAVFVPDTQPTGWVAPLTASKLDFTSGTETLYKAYFNKADWGGNLQAFPVDATGAIDAANPRWTGGAATILNAQNYDSGRKIVTLKTDGARIPFRWLTPGLGNTATTVTDQGALLGSKTTGPAVLNYLRGDRSNEAPNGANYRTRNTVLGDIVHSRPYYDAHDPANPRIYVGANDGMLHAFNATTGAEVFAYVPSMLFPRLAGLTVDNDPYVHKYFVDGTPNARTVTISGVTRTILAGSIGAGGRGLYALDISDPNAADEAAAASKILWEITPTAIKYNGSSSAVNTYASLGYSYGVPLIVRVNSNSGEWAAIVGNGYNSGNGRTSLLVINLATGALISEIVANSTGSSTNPGGLSQPSAIDTTGDGIVDAVYAGDIDGNMWKFNLSSSSTGSWSVSKLYATSPAQAITGAPSVTPHSLGGYIVNFATGRMFNAADASSTSTFYVYGLRDNGTTITPGNSTLVSQTLAARNHTACPAAYANCVRITSNNAVDYTNGKQGWRMALPVGGERVVGDGSFVDSLGRYTLMSTNPTIAHANVDGALQPKGENWLMEVAYDTGGIGGTTAIFDINADGTLDTSDLLPVSGNDSRIPIARMIRFGVTSQPILAGLATGRRTYFNSNADVDGPSNPTGGVGGGHFDFDIYYNACDYEPKVDKKSGAVTGYTYDCPKNVHKHEYDDTYNTTGVNMLNPSMPAMNLNLAIPLNSTKNFKIIMSNQKLSPAAGLKVGTSADPDEYIPVYNFLTTPGQTVASLPTYTRATLARLTLNLPVNAFSVRDWSGTGDSRVGVVPGNTGCVRSNANKSGTGSDPWMNGALTIQIVDADTTTENDVELNVGGDPSMGYRLKKTAQAKQLAQYTMFWHSEPHVCYGDPGYDPNPELEATNPSGTTPPGSGDPTGGFNGGTNTGGTGTQIVLDVDFINASNTTQTTTANSPGADIIVIATTGCTGAHCVPPPSPPPLQAPDPAASGRLSWRELIRP